MVLVGRHCNTEGGGHGALSENLYCIEKGGMISVSA